LGEPEVLKEYDDQGILIFNDPCRAARAIHAICGFRQAAPRAIPSAPPVTLPDTTPDEAGAKEILAGCGIACAPEQAVQTVEEAVGAAETFGYPVVMKILSPDILHKSDIGAVKLDLGDADAVRAAYTDIGAAVAKHAPDARVSGMLVAKQLSGGVECLMGINRDPAFGPMAVFGLGGIFVELLNDVAVQACPFDAESAREMILSIRGASILKGARGQPAVDIDALAQMLSQLSMFAAGTGDRLVSVDLNPVLALAEGAYALDAVIEMEDR